MTEENKNIIKNIIINGLRGTPSGHNTQPWKFEIVQNDLDQIKINIHPDFEKRLPIVDSDNRELYISLGCAIEAISIAATKYGYKMDPYKFIDINKSDEKNINEAIVLTEITLKKLDGLEKNSLYSYLQSRQTNRNVYDNKKIEESIIDQLKEVRTEENIGIHLYEKGDKPFEEIKLLVKEGNEVQMNDDKFKKELMSFMRFNSSEVDRSQDGLTYYGFGLPPCLPFISKKIMSMFLNDKSQNKDDIKKIDSSSHIVLFTINNDGKTNYEKISSWLKLGITLERFLLTLTSFENIAAAFINQPCEVKEILEKFKKYEFLSSGELPNILLRIGYSNKKLKLSPRKSIDKVLIN